MTQENSRKNGNQEIKEDYETYNLEKPDFKFIPKGYHEWKQRGPYLVCLSCDLEHGVYIGVEKHLTGINEKGEPILKDVKIDR